MCRWCGDVLVSTMATRRYEFYCVSCGRSETFFGPRAAVETPELRARMQQRETEYDTLSEGLIGDGAMYLNTCTKCKETHEPHRGHATSAEIDADKVARARLRARVSVALGVDP